MGLPIRDSKWTVEDRATKIIFSIAGIVVKGESCRIKEMARDDHYLTKLYQKAFTSYTYRDRKAANRLRVLKIELSPVIAGYTNERTQE